MKLLLLVLLALAACGGDTVVDDTVPPPDEPVFYGQVQKIFNDNCVSCHSQDPERLAPFALVTYEEAVTAATDYPMAYDVLNRIMPPFYADQDGDCGSYRDAHWLDPEELDTLVAWLNGSMLAGDPANSIAPPPPPGGLPHVDHTVDTGIAYKPDPNVPDDFRCFVVDPVGQDAFVIGAHVRPGNLNVAHHVILFTLDEEAEAEAVQRQADAGGPYRCTGGPTRNGNANFLVGWVPGNQATMFPADTGIRIDRARKMVVQMHYNLANNDGEPDRTTIELALAPSVSIPGRILRISAPIRLPPRDPDATAVGSVTLGDNANARLWGFGLHMHQRGTGGQMVVKNDNNRCLMNLVNWSFHWQHFYWYTEPQPLSGGDTVELTCHFDTSNDKDEVGFCEGTECEMCINFGYVTR